MGTGAVVTLSGSHALLERLYSQFQRCTRVSWEEAGFASGRFYAPLYTYWFPFAIEPISGRQRILSSLDRPDLENASEDYQRAAIVSREQQWFIKIMTWLGLIKVFCIAFVVIGRKQRPITGSPSQRF